jgi:hypothetical protein
MIIPIIAKKVTHNPELSISLESKNPDPKAMALGGVLIGKAIEEEHIKEMAMVNMISP